MSLKLNEPHNIHGIFPQTFFRRFEWKHLNVAQAIGIRPLASRVARKWKDERKVKYIATNDLYAVDSLTHSVPYLIPGRLPCSIQSVITFDSLAAKGLNPNKITVTSVLHKRRCQAFAPSQRQCIRKFRSLLRHDIRCQLETLPESRGWRRTSVTGCRSDTLKLKGAVRGYCATWREQKIALNELKARLFPHYYKNVKTNLLVLKHQNIEIPTLTYSLQFLLQHPPCQR